MLLQCVQLPGPQPPVGLEPGINFRQRARPELIPPALRITADPDEASLAQHPQVLGRARLAEPHQAGQLTDRARLQQQQVQDAPPVRIRQDVKGSSHAWRIAQWLYTMQGIYDRNGQRLEPWSRGT